MEDIYIVLSIVLIIWIGIFSYMMYLDKEVKNLKNKMDGLYKTGNIK